MAIRPSFNFAVNPVFYCSFINQMPSFLIGIFAYNHYKDIVKASYWLITPLAVLFVTCKLSLWDYRGVFAPFLMSATFVTLLSISYSRIHNSRLTDLISKIGKNSYSIYLIHTFVVWDITKIIIHATGINDSIGFMLWFPVAIIVSYIFASQYNRMILVLEKLIFKKTKSSKQLTNGSFH